MDVEFRITHSLGRLSQAWPSGQPGIDFRHQNGIRDHVEHNLKFHEQGKLK
jgi:hypothetical protein